MNMQNRVRFVELMRAGQVAYAKGKRRRAHQLWQHAAMLSPYEEQVWLALLNVLDSDEDRRVCLENIVAINPRNLQAREQLSEVATASTRPIAPVAADKPQWRSRLSYVLLRVAESIVIGVFLAAVLLFIIYSVTYHF